jgi:tRNA(Glu) U13 pseudouridine synthase TruD
MKPTGLIKLSPIDFIVCEMVAGGYTLPIIQSSSIGMTPSNVDDYIAYVATKIGMSTKIMIRQIAKKAEVDPRDITYHGLKDQNALTTQLICLPRRHNQEKLKSLNSIYLQFSHTTPHRLRLSGHIGNYFQIRVYSNGKVGESIRNGSVDTFLNRYGHQRFRGHDCHLVGANLLTGNYERAASLLCFKSTQSAFADSLQRNNFDYKKSFLDPIFFHQHTSFILCQVQSYLFNKLLDNKGHDYEKADKVFMFSEGNQSLYEDYGLFRESNLDVDFLQRMGKTKRSVWASANDLSFVSGNGSYTFNFNLQPGTYATVFLNQLFDLNTSK